jgi:hypothetical protein
MVGANSTPNNKRHDEAGITTLGGENKMTLLNLKTNAALWYKVSGVLFLFLFL